MNRANGEIRAPKVRLIDEQGEQKGVLSLAEALAYASSVSLDLVEVSPNATPPVCRIMNYGKYRYEAQKTKKKQKKQTLKEVKFRPVTDVGDFMTKVAHIEKFLAAGAKVKVTVRFRGREMMHQDLGLDILKRVLDKLGDQAQVDQHPKPEGRMIVMMLSSTGA